MPMTCLKFDVEDAALFLRCAIKNFRILREELETDLLVMEQTGKFLGTRHMMDCCDAMCCVTRELDRIQEELDAIAASDYKHEKEG